MSSLMEPAIRCGSQVKGAIAEMSAVWRSWCWGNVEQALNCRWSTQRSAIQTERAKTFLFGSATKQKGLFCWSALPFLQRRAYEYSN